MCDLSSSSTPLAQLAVKQRIVKGLPLVFYKYLADNKFTKNVINHQALWFSNPNVFNDPFDCVSFIDNATSKELNKWLAHYNISSGPDSIKLLKSKVEHVVNSVLSKQYILCLSKEYDNILLWSHYAQNHAGLCLGFDISKDPNLFTPILDVHYIDRMIRYNHFLDSSKIIEKVILSKFKMWEYENEVRIVKPNCCPNSKGRGAEFKFMPKCLISVYFGCRLKDNKIKKYITLFEENGFSHLKYYKMKLPQNGEYKMIAEEVV